jgi:hypothetical protein
MSSRFGQDTLDVWSFRGYDAGPQGIERGARKGPPENFCASAFVTIIFSSQEEAMASLTKVTETRRANRDRKMALRRRRRVQKLQKALVEKRKEVLGQ